MDQISHPGRGYCRNYVFPQRDFCPGITLCEPVTRAQSDANLLPSLEAGKFDLAVSMVEAAEEERFKSARLRTEKIVLFACPEHPLASKRKVEPQDLSGQTLLLTGVGCAFPKKLEQILALQRIRPGNITEFSTVEAIRERVSMGMGLGLLPEVVVAGDIARKRVVPLPWVGPDMIITTYAVWHKEKWISPALSAFVSLPKERIADNLHAPSRSKKRIVAHFAAFSQPHGSRS
jgi:DNA-binding transcriptional LysR family regulator